MADSPILAARCPVEWQQQIQAIATAAGRKESEVVREANAQYLGKTDPYSVKGAKRGSTRAGGQRGAEVGGIGTISWVTMPSKTDVLKSVICSEVYKGFIYSDRTA